MILPLSFPAASMLLFGTTAILITPGPTNTLLAAAGLQNGVRRAAPLIAIELAGYLIAISAWGCLLIHASSFLSWTPTFIRLASGIYVAMLAVRMWRSAAEDIAARGSPASTRTLFLATLLNPKAMLFAGTIFPSTAFSDIATYLQTMTIFSTSLVPIGLIWVMFGAALGAGRLPLFNPKRVHQGAAVVLGVFAAALSWTVIR